MTVRRTSRRRLAPLGEEAAQLRLPARPCSSTALRLGSWCLRRRRRRSALGLCSRGRAIVLLLLLLWRGSVLLACRCGSTLGWPALLCRRSSSLGLFRFCPVGVRLVVTDFPRVCWWMGRSAGVSTFAAIITLTRESNGLTCIALGIFAPLLAHCPLLSPNLALPRCGCISSLLVLCGIRLSLRLVAIGAFHG